MDVESAGRLAMNRGLLRRFIAAATSTCVVMRQGDDEFLVSVVKLDNARSPVVIAGDKTEDVFSQA